ncbi:MAG: LytTR family DNA-binding domain-containing protein [Ignavibacteriaceae bacterium]
MKTIIVDDEPKAIELINGYIQHFENIEVVATFRNGIKAFEFLQNEKVDLVFLDINMPHLSGISLSKMIDQNTKFIFTTAYSEYAVESYELEAIDYLLKPISFERFTKAIQKVFTINHSPTAEAEGMLMIKSGSKIYRVDPKDILFLEKEGNYMTYHLKDKKILARETIGEALKSLPNHFIQIHKSRIVNINKIDFINKDELSINNKLLSVGSSFKKELLNKMKFLNC